jgi:hypothetical protein
MDLFECIDSFQELVGIRKRGQIANFPLDYTQKTEGPSTGSSADVQDKIKYIFDTALQVISQSHQPDQIISNLATELKSYLGSLQSDLEKLTAKQAVDGQLTSLTNSQYFQTNPNLLNQLNKLLGTSELSIPPSKSPFQSPNQFSVLRAYRLIEKATTYLDQVDEYINQPENENQRSKYLQLLNQNVIEPLTTLREQAKNTSGVGNLIADIDKVFNSIAERLLPESYAALKRLINNPFV